MLVAYSSERDESGHWSNLTSHNMLYRHVQANLVGNFEIKDEDGQDHWQRGQNQPWNIPAQY